MTAPRYYKDCPCPRARCGGFLDIRTTSPDNDGDGMRTRYFVCRKCGHRCSCEVPAASVRTRKVVANNQ